MKPALIEGATNNPACPEGVRGGRLPIKVTNEDGQTHCYSAWKPSEHELKMLNEGGYVMLTVVGWQVPVALNVMDKAGAQELG
jgi:hypothetical protein